MPFDILNVPFTIANVMPFDILSIPLAIKNLFTWWYVKFHHVPTAWKISIEIFFTWWRWGGRTPVQKLILSNSTSLTYFVFSESRLKISKNSRFLVSLDSTTTLRQEWLLISIYNTYFSYRESLE